MLPFVSLSDLVNSIIPNNCYMYVVSEDFQCVSLRLEFLPNESNLIITIPLINDIFPEETEEFEVFLSASPDVFIDSPAYARVVILDDDPDFEGRDLL